MILISNDTVSMYLMFSFFMLEIDFKYIEAVLLLTDSY